MNSPESKVQSLKSRVQQAGRTSHHSLVSGFEPRVLRFGVRACLLGLWTLDFGLWTSAATNPATNYEIPLLRPPRPEIPPTFWEQNRMWIVAPGIVLAIVACGLVWWARRPRPPMIMPPEAQARLALEDLRAKPEDGVVLSRVSQILRHYLATAFWLPQEELTTAEFCNVIASNPRVGSELASAAGVFLQQCDVRKFAPGEPKEALAAVPRALQLLEQAEARRAQLRQNLARK
jgi:hypothetical protein